MKEDKAFTLAIKRYSAGAIHCYPRGAFVTGGGPQPDRMHIIYYVNTKRVIDVRFG